MAFKIPRVHTQDRLINQLQSNICPPIEAQFQGLTGQFQVALTGCSTVVEATAIWQRSTAFGPITVYFPSLRGLSNTTAATVTGLPVELWPKFTQLILAPVENNSVIAMGLVVITEVGTITLVRDLTNTVFTASNNKGLRPCVVTYLTVNN